MHSEAVDAKITKRVHSWGRGSVFTQNQFFDLGSRAAVDKALSRLATAGKIRRLSRGIYDYPREHPELGLLHPKIEEIAKALTAKDQIRLQPSGAYAANLLGLTEQVPAKIVFLTDGPTRSFKIGTQEIRLQRTTAKNMAAANRFTGLLIQAFRHLGKGHVTGKLLAHLKGAIPEHEKGRLSKDLSLAPAWMHPFFRELAQA